MAISNVDTTTTGAVFRPEVWSPLVLEFREKNLIAAKLFERRDVDISKFGYKIHFPITTVYTAADYTEGGKLEDSLKVNTETEKTITVDKYKVAPFMVSDLLDMQSKYDKMAADFRSAGEAIARAIETDILALSASFTNSAINAAGTAVTNVDLTEAQQVLDEQDVPEDNRFWLLSPRTIKDLMDLTGNYFTSMDFSDTKSMIKGSLGRMILGSPAYKHNLLPSATTGSPATTYYKNIYAHKEAIGVAMQKDVETQREYSVNFQGTMGNVRAVYGVGILRANHGVIINGR